MAEVTSDMRVLATELVRRANEETRRTRLLEQKVDRIEAELSNLEAEVAAQKKELKLRFESFEKNMKIAADRIMIIDSAVGRIEKELAKKVNKTELKQIESYIDLISPIKSRFVTKEEMERAISEKMAKKY